MDVDNNILLERYFSSHNSPYEKTHKVSKHVKFAEPQDFQKKLLQLYSESGTNNLPAIYNLVENTFGDQDMVLSHVPELHYLEFKCWRSYFPNLFLIVFFFYLYNVSVLTLI